MFSPFFDDMITKICTCTKSTYYHTGFCHYNCQSKLSITVHICEKNLPYMNSKGRWLQYEERKKDALWKSSSLIVSTSICYLFLAYRFNCQTVVFSRVVLSNVIRGYNNLGASKSMPSSTLACILAGRGGSPNRLQWLPEEIRATSICFIAFRKLFNLTHIIVLIQGTTSFFWPQEFIIFTHSTIFVWKT